MWGIARPGYPLEKPLLVYLIQVHGKTIEQSDLNYAARQNRSAERAEELVMTVAEEWTQKGQVSMLLLQLREKFGSEATKRYRQQVEQADEAMIRRWSIRFARAETIEDVFTDD